MALPRVDRPIFNTILPSTGKTLRLQPYTVKEERIMLMAKESKELKDIATATLQILRACMVDDIDIEKLPAFDIEHLMVRLREASVGEAIPLRMSVPKCDKENCPCEVGAVLNLKELTIDPIVREKNKVKLNENAFMMLRYPSMSHMQEMSTMKTDDERARLMVARCIDQIVDGEQVAHPDDYDLKDLLDWVDTFTVDQFDTIIKFFGNMPHIHKEINLKCLRCDKTEKFEVQGLEPFFI